MKLHEKEIRAVYTDTIIELMTENSNVVCLEADLGKSSGTVPRVWEAFPDRFFDVGVAEANMMSISAGLANEGLVPFCATFTPFATRRAYDQITISIAYAENPVKIVGTAPGVTTAKNGATHMCFQDLAIMRAMPNMRVYCPADVYELRSTVRYMAASKKPEYMQLIREVVDYGAFVRCLFCIPVRCELPRAREGNDSDISCRCSRHARGRWGSLGTDQIALA